MERRAIRSGWDRDGPSESEHPVLNPDTTLVTAETAVSLVLLRGRALGRIDRLPRHMSATGKLRRSAGSGEATDLHPGAFVLTNVN
jgi:hypothetical protein